MGKASRSADPITSRIRPGENRRTRATRGLTSPRYSQAMTVLSRGARVRRGGRRPGWVLLTALLVLAMGASSALVFTNRVELLKLAVILALWAAVAGAFVSVLYRRQSDADQSRVRDLKLVYDLQLDREISARREYELTVESQLRRELASELRAQAADDVAALRAELAALRTSLEILFDTDLEHHRALEKPQTLETDAAPARAYSDWARNGESPPVDWVSSDRVTAVRPDSSLGQTDGRTDETSIIDVPEVGVLPHDERVGVLPRDERVGVLPRDSGRCPHPLGACPHPLGACHYPRAGDRCCRPDNRRRHTIVSGRPMRPRRRRPRRDSSHASRHHRLRHHSPHAATGGAAVAAADAARTPGVAARTPGVAARTSGLEAGGGRRTVVARRRAGQQLVRRRFDRYTGCRAVGPSPARPAFQPGCTRGRPTCRGRAAVQRVRSPFAIAPLDGVPGPRCFGRAAAPGSGEPLPPPPAAPPPAAPLPPRLAPAPPPEPAPRHRSADSSPEEPDGQERHEAVVSRSRTCWRDYRSNRPEAAGAVAVTDDTGSCLPNRLQS